MDNLSNFDHWKYHVRYWWGIYHIRQAYIAVRDLFFPRQAWAVKGMYHGWCDKPELIEEFLYRCIVNYVEEEKCFEYNDWSNGYTYKECEKFIRECYEWITIRRPELCRQIQQIISDAYDSVAFESWLKKGGEYTGNKKTYDEIYPNLDKLEKELDEADQKYLTGIVKWHKYFWT